MLQVKATSTCKRVIGRVDDNQSQVENNLQDHKLGVNYLFTRIREIDGNKYANPGLHLSDAPIGVMGVSNKHSRCKDKMTHNTTTTTTPAEMQAMTAQPDCNAVADISVLLVARLCHDLASPLGAIGNGVELLELIADRAGPELDMVSTSVRQATSRLRLFRFAFGPAQPDQLTGVAEMRALLKAHDETARFWTEYAIDQDLPRAHAKLLLLGLMCVETALAWGGTVRITSTPDGYDLRAVAERLRLDPPLWAMFGSADVVPAPNAATIHFPMFKRYAAEQGFDVSCDQHPSSLAVVLRSAIRDM